MPFDWAHFLTLAEELALRADEASKRTAISRAYYSIFNVAFHRAEVSAGPFAGGEGTHKWCWNKYMDGRNSFECRQIGIMGDRLRAKRVKADYKNGDIVRLDDEVARALADARQFRADLAALHIRYPLR
jgi:hypothetical protein